MWLLLLSCQAEAPPDARPLTPCHVEGVTEETLCTTVLVPEDRQHPQTRQLELEVVVLPAIRPEPLTDPVFFLAGGPGQAATTTISMVLGPLDRVHRTRDLVFINQRGTYGSHSLACPSSEDDPGALESDAIPDQERLGACLKSLPGDPRFYTTEQAILDFETARQALGYGPVNLVGGSYGTRAALTWARMFPTSIRSMVLDGVAGPEVPLFVSFGQDASASLERTLKDCERQEGCHKAFPDLRGDLERLFAQLPVPATTLDPTTGEPLSGTWTRKSVASALRAALYSPELSALLPLAIHQAANNDFSPLASLYMGMSSGTEVSDGLMFSVTCAEDLPRVTRDLAGRVENDSIFSDDALSLMRTVCAHWPAGKPPDGYDQPVVSDHPTLLLSGELDPVTPPRQAEEAAKNLSRARSLVAPGASHIVMGRGCSPKLIADFIENAAQPDPFATLDQSCIGEISRPPFFINRMGAP